MWRAIVAWLSDVAEAVETWLAWRLVRRLLRRHGPMPYETLYAVLTHPAIKALRGRMSRGEVWYLGGTVGLRDQATWQTPVGGRGILMQPPAGRDWEA